jgi:hypothetical protein
MKKRIKAFVSVLALLLAVSSVALATNTGPHNVFDYNTISTTEGADRVLNLDWSTAKTVRPTRLYVRHDLVGTYNGVFTNVFRCQIYEMYNSTLYGSNDFMAPGTANYIRSDSIQLAQHFKVWGRANTKYTYATIDIAGYMAQDG